MGRAVPHYFSNLAIAPGASQRPHRFLIVDEDRNQRRSLAIGLRVHGHHAEEAGSAAEALAHPALGTIDFVVVELLLADMSGLEVAQRLRRMFPLLRIALSSAYEISPAHLSELGFRPAALFQKPMRTEELLGLLPAEDDCHS